MNVSFADITIVHRVVFGEPQPGDMSFKAAAEKIIAARPDDWQHLMRLSEQLRKPEWSYQQIAEAVRAKLGDAA